MAVLAPEHYADLDKSGLTEATVSLIQVAGASPTEAKRHGADSAYALPYFQLDGSVNGFHRLKLLPPVKTSSGTMRYWQPPNTSPHLYLPPLLSWLNVARHATTELTITEGEKKAAAACQHGLITAAVGGVWNWTSTLDTGERLTLPMLDEFHWTNRSVLVCPDSDAWRDGKGVQILMGFFALAKELQSRGATVQFVRLSDSHGAKTGLDDWLLIPGNDVEHSWPKLERIALDDPRFETLAAWWQKWKEKQATHAAIKDQDAEELEISETAGLFLVHSKAHSVRMTFDRLSEARGGVYAELSIMLGTTEIRSGIDLGLKSDSGQSKLAAGLHPLAPAVPWKWLLQKACALVLKRHREGEPPAHLNKHSTVEPLTYAINPLVPRRKSIILFADGGKGKSTYALMLAMLVSTGQSVAGFSALPGKALFLDWEDDVDVHTRRLHAVRAGHPELDHADVAYQRCCEPLTKLTHDLARTIQAEGITFVVIDSLLAAMGGDASAEAVGRFFAAVRVFQVESLLIGHTPKTLAEGQEHATVYGSVFNQNFARGVWELKTEQEIGADSAILGLFHRKSNLTRKHQPIGLKVTHTQDGSYIRYDPYDLSQAAELKKALPWPNQIRTLLESDGVPRSSQEIADALWAPLATIKVYLSNYKGVKWHMVGENRDAKWTALNR